MWARWWHRCERCLIYNIIRLFRIRSATETVARGFAVGLVVNFFPTFGFGVLASGFLAKLAGGSAVAGLVGGATLGFVWPILFLFNMRVGSLFIRSPIQVEDLEDVTEKTISALIWGKTFTVGAILNSLLVGGAAYFIILFAYQRIRPSALAYFRQHARDHQRRFRGIKPPPRGR